MKKFILLILLFAFFLPVESAETRYYRVGGNYYNTFPTDTACTSCDPFYVRINGNNYYMLIDNGGKYTYENILGCTWPKSALFEPMRILDKNYDGKVSAQELKDGNIRFVKLAAGRKLAVDKTDMDYDLENIDFIDLKWVRIDAIGIPRGSFDVYLRLKNNTRKKIIGRTSPIDMYAAKRMLGY